MPITLKSILWTIHITLALLWIYQGLVPKIIHQVNEEHLFWQFTGIDFVEIPVLITLSGGIEVIFGALFLIFRTSKVLHMLNIVGLILLAGVVFIIYPNYFLHAFNPFVMNIAMASLSVVALQLHDIQPIPNKRII